VSSGDGAIGRHTRVVAGLTLVSRVLGLVRDLVTVRVFGDTVVGSAFAAAFAVPNMFRRLFGEGALSAAFIPVYTRLSDEDPDRAGALATLTIGLLALVTGVITLVIELGVWGVILVAPEDGDRVFSLELVMVMLPFMPLICVAAILGGMLQSHGRFGPWAAAPVLLNVCVIGACVPYFVVEGAEARAFAFYIGIAAVVSAGLQVVWSLWALRGLMKWKRGASEVRSEARAMLRRMVPVMIGLGTLQLNTFVDTLIAMYPNWVGGTVLGREYPLDGASNAVLFYAQRLYQFPLGVFGIAVATAAFPALARAAGDSERFGGMLRRGVRLSLFIGLPSSVGLVCVGPALVRVLYSGGDSGFSDGGAVRAGWVLVAYSCAVWAYSLNQLFTRSMYARDDMTTPMRIALGMVGANVVLNVVLIWWLREAGLAVSTAVCAVGQCVLLARAAKRDSGSGGRILDGETGASVGRIVVRSVMVVPVALGCVWGARVLGDSMGWGAWTTDVVGVGSAVVLSAGLFLGIAWAKRDSELSWLTARMTDTA